MPLILPPPLHPNSFNIEYKDRTCQNIFQFLTSPASGECLIRMVINMNSAEKKFIKFQPSLNEIKSKISDVVRYGFELALVTTLAEVQHRD